MSESTTTVFPPFRCLICGNKKQVLYLCRCGTGMMNMCSKCKGLDEFQRYEKLRDRIYSALQTARLLASESYRDGNQEAFNEMSDVVKCHTEMLETLHKPAGYDEYKRKQKPL